MIQNSYEESENQNSLPNAEYIEIYSKNWKIKLLYLSLFLFIIICIFLISFIFQHSLSDEIEKQIPTITKQFSAPNFNTPVENLEYFKFSYLAPSGYTVIEENLRPDAISNPILKTIAHHPSDDCIVVLKDKNCNPAQIEFRILQLSAFDGVQKINPEEQIAKKVLNALTFEAQDSVEIKRIRDNTFYTNNLGNFLYIDKGKEFGLYIIFYNPKFYPILETIVPIL